MPYRKALLIHSGRQPFEVALLTICILVGLVGLLTGSTSKAIEFILGDWSWIWNAGLVVGGAFTLVGVSLRLPESLLWERIGMVWLSTLFLTLGTAVIALYWDQGFTAVGFLLAYGFAAAVRVIHIGRDLKVLSQALTKRPIILTDETLLADPREEDT